MKTHKDALYVRQKGDKKRPVFAYRPTLKRIQAELGKINRLSKALRFRVKNGTDTQETINGLQYVRQRRAAIRTYLTSLAA